MTYILILFAYAGMLSKGDSNSLHSVPGFVSLEDCTSAGKQSQRLVSGTVKEMAFVCVAQSNAQRAAVPK